jgi:transcriptional regulator with XRE-family HTH domain
MTIGNALRLLRHKKGISLRKLGTRVGVSAAYLCDVELGRRNISEELLTKVANACNSGIVMRQVPCSACNGSGHVAVPWFSRTGR